MSDQDRVRRIQQDLAALADGPAIVIAGPAADPVSSTPAEPREPERLAPPDVLRAAADAADDAICRRLDHNQVVALIADAVWRLAYERGHAAGHGKAVAVVQRPDLAAYERGKAEQAEALAKAQRVADSLGRRLGVRYGEIEQLRAELAQMRDERDAALERGKAEGVDARPDREAAKALTIPALHQLDVRINNLRGDCHCNLVAEVVLDALYGLNAEVIIDGSADPTGGGQDGQ